MKIEKGEILILDDDTEYGIVDKINYEEEEYLYLASVNRPLKLRVCKVSKDKEDVFITDVKDEDKIRKILSKIRP